MIRGMRVAFDVDGWFLCFEKKLANSADAEAVIRGLGSTADLYGIFVYDVLVGLGVASYVRYVPAQFFEERVDEFSAKLGLIILLRTVGVDVAVKRLDKFCNSWRYVSHLGVSP